MSEGRNTELVSSWREAMEGVTPGPWRREAQGGASTVLTTTRPPRNDTRIPAYGYRDEGEHCLAYPFIEEGGRARWDFVSFGHNDAAWIARCSPSGISALLDALESTSRALSEKEGELVEARELIAAMQGNDEDIKEAIARAGFTSDIWIVHALDQACEQWAHFAEAAETTTRQRDEALAALKASEERGWQPIETAPKDGTRIDLWAVRQTTGKASRYSDCVWARHVWGSEEVGEPCWQNLDDRYSIVTPTHWMPLPDPPQALENGPSALADATKKDPGTEQREAGV